MRRHRRSIERIVRLAVDEEGLHRAAVEVCARPGQRSQRRETSSTRRIFFPENGGGPLRRSSRIREPRFVLVVAVVDMNNTQGDPHSCWRSAAGTTPPCAMATIASKRSPSISARTRPAPCTRRIDRSRIDTIASLHVFAPETAIKNAAGVPGASQIFAQPVEAALPPCSGRRGQRVSDPLMDDDDFGGLPLWLQTDRHLLS